MNPRLFLLLIASALATAALGADYTNPTFANPDTPGLLAGSPSPDGVNVADMVFIKQLAIGGRAEVELGKLADQRGEAPGVDRFAQHMIKDHGAANSRLTAVARGAKVEIPKQLDAEHEAALAELGRHNGAAFDLKYIESQIEDHQKAVQLLIYEIGSGQNLAARKFAAETLPTVMAHLEEARSVHAQLTKAEREVAGR